MQAMPRLRVKKAWFMAAEITEPKPFSILPPPCSATRARLGIR